ncbi:helicase [archaeon SCG-AAA382B04]|nr:helicase [archaeon SCG-AAA382B04]
MMSSFDLLSERVKKALNNKGFKSPTPVQSTAIPNIKEGNNVLLISPTGSGKTEAAALPVFDTIKKDKRGIKALYITPLKALNRDIVERLQWWGDRLDLDVEVRHGDTSSYQRRQQAKEPPDFLVLTPETLQAILPGSKMKKHLSHVNHVIIDEVHDLADSKRGIQLSLALERLEELNNNFQRIGLSATVGNPKEVSKLLLGDKKPKILQEKGSKSSIYRIKTPKEDSDIEEIKKRTMLNEKRASELAMIMKLIKNHESSLIFVNTREIAETLSSRFNLLEIDVGIHHGSLSKPSRLEAEKNFKEGNTNALICTSSMELGIDIGEVDLVVQYNSPRQVFRLVQRVGRSGHTLEESSKGVLVCSNPDDITESSVIVNKANNNELENIYIRTNCFDVLSNQIAGLTLDKGTIKIQKIHKIIKNSYPFSNTTKNEVKEVIKQMRQNRIIYYDKENKEIDRTNRTWQYYYNNLSMIPDEKNYEVTDITSGSSLASLDESFVASFAKPGTVFIAQGKMWKILSIEDQEIRVEEVKDPQGTIPNWVGEEIPVSYEVAQKVGKTRKEIAQKIERNQKINSNEYFLNKNALKKLKDYLKTQISSNYIVPDDKNILVEITQNEIIINACYGHRVNKTLGQAITSLLTSKIGSSVGLDVGPYRIKLKLPKSIKEEVIKEIIQIEPNHLKSILELSLKNTSLFKWELIKVAKKFGAIEKGAEYDSFRIEKLLEIFEGTPIYKEAINEIMNNKLELEKTKKVLEKIKNNRHQISVNQEKTPIGQSGFSSYEELVSPDKAGRPIIKALKERISDEKTLLFCLNCKDWNITKKVERINDEPTCPKCNSKLISALKPWEKEEIKEIKKTGKKPDRIENNANLVLSHGKEAIKALVGRGIGPKTASRVLKNFPEEEELYKRILEEERKYARTHMFWD